MAAFKAKFPAKPMKRQLHGKGKKEMISYHDRDEMDPGGLEFLRQLSAMEAKIIDRSKTFRQGFGSRDEDDVVGFELDVRQRFTEKNIQIQQQILSLQTQLIENGMNQSTPMDKSKPVSTGSVNAASIVSIASDVKENTQPKSSIGPTGKVLDASRIVRESQTSAAVSTKYSVFTTPLSPLPLRPVRLGPYHIPISAIPIVKHAKDVPSDTEHRSGKYIVESDTDSDSDSDVEIIEYKSRRFNSNFVLKKDVKPVAKSGPTLIRLNQCPMDDVRLGGFPVIVDKVKGRSSPKALCFTCGSAGISQLIFCSSCCEPYHPFCTGDDGLLSAYVSCLYSDSNEPTNSTKPCEDLTTASINLNAILSPPITPKLAIPDTQRNNEKWVQLKRLLRSWVCTRCYICYICKRHELPTISIDSQHSAKDLKYIKCPYCPRVVHINCCPGGRKGISANQKTRICEQCYKCTSCGKRIERRILNNRGRSKNEREQQLCTDCVRQKNKGSYCPLCSVCYDDEDFDVKMMECAKCEHWIHADCELISEEQYQLLSSLPESVEYICRTCEDPTAVFWRKAIRLQIESGWREVLHLFQNHVMNSCRKLRILQPSSCENTPVKSNSKVPDSNSRHLVSKSPSPSIKENSSFVRELFPKKPSKSKPKIKRLRGPFSSSRKLNRTNLLGTHVKECSVLLQDISKHNSIAISETNSVYNQSLMKLPPSEMPAKPTVELQNYATPSKKCVNTSGESPSKRINSLIESISTLSSILSVKSIYKEAVNVIILSEVDGVDSNSVRTHFVSAFAKVFSWFNPKETDEHEVRSEISEDNLGFDTNNILEEDTYKVNEVSREELVAWNPFEDFYWDKAYDEKSRVCAFCQESGDSPEGFCGRLLWANLTEWVHVNCALWSSEVWEENDGALKQVGVALTRSKSLHCLICRKKGASVACCVQSCPKSFHFPCALQSSCILLEDKGMFCSEHIGRAKGPRQQDMRVLRQVYVDTDWMRKKDKVVLSNNLGIYIGSLKIEALGHLIPLSVYKECEGETALVPLGYEASRVFWSFDVSSTSSYPQKVKYSVCTEIKKQEARKTKYCVIPKDINIRVDHTKSPKRVRRKLKQVKSFHNWIDTTPKYVDEYHKEWLYPCRLVFTDSESNGSDADGETSDHEFLVTSTKSENEYNSLENCFTEAEIEENLRVCSNDLIPMESDWQEMEITSAMILEESNGAEIDDTVDSTAETEIFEELDSIADTGTESDVCSMAEEENIETDGNDDVFTKNRNLLIIPQVDGAGDSESETSEEDDDSNKESSDSSSSNSSSIDEIETQRKVPARKTRFATKVVPLRSSAKPSKVKGKKGSAKKEIGTVKIARTPATGVGRTLRSRKKLQDAKIASQKKLEFKCSQCKKDCTSQTSLTRHSKLCKQKKGGKPSKPNKRSRRNSTSSSTVTEAGPSVVETSRRGRKPKKVPTLRGDVDHQPEQSTSTNIVEKISNFQGLRINSVEDSNSLEKRARRQEPIVGEDGKVYCTRCKNTYRTTLSYNNHLGNCFYLSSDDDEQDNEQFNPEESSSEIIQVANESALRREENESESETTTSSDYSDEIHPTPSLRENPSPILETERESAEVEQSNDNAAVDDEGVKSENEIRTNEQNLNDSTPYCESTGQFASETDQTFDEEIVDAEYAEGGDIAIEVKETFESNEEMAEEEMCADTEDGSNEGEELFETTAEQSSFLPELMSFPIADAEPDVVSAPIQDQIEYTEDQSYEADPVSTPVQLTHATPLVRHTWSQPQEVNSENTCQVPFPEYHTAGSDSLVYPMPPQSTTQLTQNQNETHSLPVVQHSFHNLSQSCSSFQQQMPSPFFSHQPPTQRQLQTVTFQDSNTGQLMTIQVPAMSQQHLIQSSNPPFHPPFQHGLPPPHFHGSLQHQTEGQYEQYKQQIQAAIQLQRNSVLQQNQQGIYNNLQQQHAMFEQHHLPRSFESRFLNHSGHHGEHELQHSHIGQQAQGGESSASTSMLLSVNPAHQHEMTLPMTSHPPPSQLHPTHRHQSNSSSDDGITTYMVVQQGNSQSLTALDAHAQGHEQHRSYQLNSEQTQGNFVTTHHHSPILLTQPDSLVRIPVERNPLNHPSNQNCLRQQIPQRITSCSCAECLRVPNTLNVVEMHPPIWAIHKPLAISTVRKAKAGKIRARLASIVSERQGQGLQLFRSLTCPNATLPKLLPATTAPTPTTSKMVPSLSLNITAPTTESPGIFKPPPLPAIPTVATTVTSDSLAGPIVSASTAPTLLKAPTPSPNIAVVRPMEHPLQKMSNQIQQLESSFASTVPPPSVEPNLNIQTPLEQVPSISVFSNPQLQTLQPASVLPVIPSPERASEIPSQEVTPDVEDIKKSPTSVESSQPEPESTPVVDKSIKIRLKRQAGGDSYSVNKISGSTTTAQHQFPGMFKTLKIKGKITTGDQAGTSTDVVVQPVVYTIPIPDPNAIGDDEESNRTIVEDDTEARTCLEASVVLPVPSSLDLDDEAKTLRLTHRAVIVYEVKIDDKVQYKSCDVRAVWGYILERVQGTRRNHNLPPLAYPATNISLPENKREAAASFNKLGLTHRAVQFLLEQLPGVKNAAKEGHVFKFQEPPNSLEDTPVIENPTGCARSEGFTGRKPFDMFGWLASKHRQPEVPASSSRSLDKKGGNLPMAMKYRNMIKFGTKHLNVFWSSIHGRGLFTTKDLEAGDIIIEYAGEVIRPVLCDLREKYYESKGIGCYMFRIDDNSVVDATLKGNAARFINHSCDPNCRSKTIDILGTKHILILALRKIIAGEELTYDYKFEEEGDKLPCSCGTKKCRKFLN